MKLIKVGDCTEVTVCAVGAADDGTRRFALRTRDPVATGYEPLRTDRCIRIVATAATAAAIVRDFVAAIGADYDEATGTFTMSDRSPFELFRAVCAAYGMRTMGIY